MKLQFMNLTDMNVKECTKSLDGFYIATHLSTAVLDVVIVSFSPRLMGEQLTITTTTETKKGNP